jgi:hypothetical protein
VHEKSETNNNTKATKERMCKEEENNWNERQNTEHAFSYTTDLGYVTLEAK